MVFLDRDGVINVCAAPHHYITDFREFRFLPGVSRAIARLNREGYKVVVMTNQRCIGRGLATAAQIDALHRQMAGALAGEGARIDGIFICPHEAGTCRCRKPETGLFEQAGRRFAVDRSHSWMVGDSPSDVEAGRRFGIKTILIGGQDGGVDGSAPDLAHAVDIILKEML